MWYNNKAFDAKRVGSDWTLTIEQQKISTKHYYDSKELASAKYKSCQFKKREIQTLKSKEAKKK